MQNQLLAGQQMQNNGAANQQITNAFSQGGGAMAQAGGAALGKAIMAGGGVVTEPTVALEGEAGPEVVVPVSGKDIDMTRVKDPDLKAYLEAGGLEKTPKNVDAEEGGSDGPHMERHALTEALKHLQAAHQHLSSLGVEL
jgi:hypothetical protein